MGIQELRGGIRELERGEQTQLNQYCLAQSHSRQCFRCSKLSIEIFPYLTANDCTQNNGEVRRNISKCEHFSTSGSDRGGRGKRGRQEGERIHCPVRPTGMDQFMLPHTKYLQSHDNAKFTNVMTSLSQIQSQGATDRSISKVGKWYSTIAEN